MKFFFPKFNYIFEIPFDSSIKVLELADLYFNSTYDSSSFLLASEAADRAVCSLRLMAGERTNFPS